MSPVIRDEREREEVSSSHLLRHSKWSDIEIAKNIYKTKNSLVPGYFMKNSPALTRATLLTMDPAGLVMTHRYSWTQNVTNIHGAWSWRHVSLEWSFDLVQLSLFKGLPFNSLLIYSIVEESFALLNISDTLPVGGCWAQAPKQEMAGRWLFHYPARASDQEQSSQPGIKTVWEEWTTRCPDIASLVQMSRPPRISSVEASRELSRRLTRQCCWRNPRELKNRFYWLYLSGKFRVSSVFWEITIPSGEEGPLTWYDGGSYINLGPCALLRQQRSEKFK